MRELPSVLWQSEIISFLFIFQFVEDYSDIPDSVHKESNQTKVDYEESHGALPGNIRPDYFYFILFSILVFISKPKLIFVHNFTTTYRHDIDEMIPNKQHPCWNNSIPHAKHLNECNRSLPIKQHYNKCVRLPPHHQDFTNKHKHTSVLFDWFLFFFLLSSFFPRHYVILWFLNPRK